MYDDSNYDEFQQHLADVQDNVVSAEDVATLAGIVLANDDNLASLPFYLGDDTYASPVSSEQLGIVPLVVFAGLAWLMLKGLK